MWWFLRLSDIPIPRYSVLQHLATFCNNFLSFFWCGFSGLLNSFFGIGFALSLRACDMSSLEAFHNLRFVSLDATWFARSCTEHIYLMRLASALSTYSLHSPGQRGTLGTSEVWEKRLVCSWFHWNAYQLMVSFLSSPLHIVSSSLNDVPYIVS